MLVEERLQELGLCREHLGAFEAVIAVEACAPTRREKLARREQGKVRNVSFSLPKVTRAAAPGALRWTGSYPWR